VRREKPEKGRPMRAFGESMVAAATAASLGVSPWILPLIAIAAKRKERVRGRGLVRWLRRWSRGRAAGRRAPHVRRPVVMHERFRAKLEAAIWPD
jgi:hypothetical protein